MKKVLIGILGLSLALACNSGSSNSEGGKVKTQTSAVVQEDIPTEKAMRMLESGDIVLIDVRSADEYSSGHIKGSLNIDVNSEGFEEKVDGLDKSTTYVVYCHSGRRSAKSSDIMIDRGFKSVYNVLGGISEWKNQGYEVVIE